MGAGVNWGHATAATSSSGPAPRRRPLGFSRTEPVLSFAAASTSGASAPAAASWQSGKDILDEVYAHAALTGKRSDELRPMWETGSATDTVVSATSLASGRREDSGFFAASAGGGGPVAAVGTDADDGDGFDLDEAFGSADAARFAFGRAQEASQDSSSRNGLKRTFDDAGTAATAAGNDDEEMAATDIEEDDEDEADDSVPAGPMSMFGTAPAAAGPRRLAGLKRGFNKTQSLPPSAFAGKMEF